MTITEVVDEATLSARVSELAEQLAADYAGREPILLGCVLLHAAR